MSRLLLGVIRIYWLVWPDRWKRRCLFRESCSRHVYRVTRERGARAGLRALRTRIRTCRPVRGLTLARGEPCLVLADASLLPVRDASPEVVQMRVG